MKNKSRNLPTTIDDINIEESIYRPHILTIQVKAIIRKPEHHKTTLRIPLPHPIVKYHHNVEITIDFLFFNGSPFIHTKSRKINFKLVQTCNSRDKSEIVYGPKRFRPITKTGGSPSLISMVTINSNTSYIFITGTPAHMI